ncbi:hypothetical protein V492_04573 [Pseudogymnoascus sp. VKM F-4246]|nr:hypothetical protein V492_04573 [Pseudogymnoascus sp. VKM F-4246]
MRVKLSNSSVYRTYADQQTGDFVLPKEMIALEFVLFVDRGRQRPTPSLDSLYSTPSKVASTTQTSLLIFAIQFSALFQVHMASKGTFDEQVAEFIAKYATQQTSSSPELTEMNDTDDTTGSMDTLGNPVQDYVKIAIILFAALKFIRQQETDGKAHAYTYAMKRFQKLVSMHKEPNKRSFAFQAEVFWAMRDVIKCHAMHDKAARKLELGSTNTLEHMEKTGEDDTFELFQHYLECKAKLFEKEQELEAAIITAIEYFEEE